MTPSPDHPSRYNERVVERFRADLRALPEIPDTAVSGAPTLPRPAGGGSIAGPLPRTGRGRQQQRRTAADPTPRRIAAVALAVCVALLLPTVVRGDHS